MHWLYGSVSQSSQQLLMLTALHLTLLWHASGMPDVMVSHRANCTDLFNLFCVEGRPFPLEQGSECIDRHVSSMVQRQRPPAPFGVRDHGCRGLSPCWLCNLVKAASSFWSVGSWLTLLSCEGLLSISCPVRSSFDDLDF